MAKLPQVSGKDAVKAFESAGFVVERIKGSHHIMRKPGVAVRLSVPVHTGKNIPPPFLKSLIKAAGLTEEQFVEYL
jgi:predicted RNA binding protein YcfA (HicA-like mRNA interferase family)